MITIGDFKNNVFTNSPRNCICRFCKFYDKQQLLCTNENSDNYLSCITADGTCKKSEIICDEIWLIVRSLKKLDYNKSMSMMYVPELSPSPELYRKYLEWKAQGIWNKKVFTEKYVPNFLEDMCQTEAQETLKNLLEESKNKNIMLACYCGDETICHRSIIIGILQGMGAETYNVSDYSAYYSRYLEHLAKKQKCINENTKSNKFYLIVAGSKDYNNYREMKIILDKCLEKRKELGDEIIIVTDDTKGINSLVVTYAKNNNYKIKVMSTDWAQYGRSAGYVRTEAMHKKIATSLCGSRGCVCFWDGVSLNVLHNFSLAQKYNTPLRVYNYTTQKFLGEKEICSLIK